MTIGMCTKAFVCSKFPQSLCIFEEYFMIKSFWKSFIDCFEVNLEYRRQGWGRAVFKTVNTVLSQTFNHKIYFGYAIRKSVVRGSVSTLKLSCLFPAIALLTCLKSLLRPVYTGDFCCDLSPFDACDWMDWLTNVLDHLSKAI